MGGHVVDVDALDDGDVGFFGVVAVGDEFGEKADHDEDRSGEEGDGSG